MAHKSASSKRWLHRQENDYYTLAAKEAGYRARSAYKLIEINNKYQLLKNATNIVDLGAAPGGWSQAILQQSKQTAIKPQAIKPINIFALDILPITPIAGVTIIQGDFTEQDVLLKLEDALIGLDIDKETPINKKLDVVLSDMAPNFSGIKSVDLPHALYLAELALDFAVKHLKQGGHFVTKVFQGEGFDEFIKHVRTLFNKVHIFKPNSSRKESKEVYVIGLQVINAANL